MVRNIQRDQRNSTARGVNSKRARDLCLKIPQLNGWIAGTRRNTFTGRGLAVSFGLFRTPLLIQNEDGIFSDFTATEREESQQQHRHCSLYYSHISHCRSEFQTSLA